MTVEEQLAAIFAKLEEMDALLQRHSPTEPLHPASVPVDVDDGCEVDDSAVRKPPAFSSASASPASSASPSPTSSETTSGVAPVTTDEHEVTVSTNGKLSATSPAALLSFPTSVLPHDAALTTSVTTTNLPQVAPTGCSTFGLNKSTSALLSVDMVSVCSMAFSTSALHRDIVLTIPFATTKLMQGHKSNITGDYVEQSSTGVCISQKSHESSHGTYQVFERGEVEADASTDELVHGSECLELQPPWPPPIPVELWGCNSEVCPTPWPSLDCCSIEAQMISPWPPPAVLKTLGVSLTTACIIEEFSNPLSVFACCDISKESWPPSEHYLLILHLSIGCVSNGQITGCATINFSVELCMCKKHWLEFLENAVQIDDCSRTLVVELLQLQLHNQIWLFTEVPVADKVTLFDCAFYLVSCLWRNDQKNFPVLSPSEEKCRLCMSSALAAVISNIRFEQCYRQPKPPWQLCTAQFFSWFGTMELINGFLLEASPWCRDSVLFLQRKLSGPYLAWLYSSGARTIERAVAGCVVKSCDKLTSEHSPISTWENSGVDLVSLLNSLELLEQEHEATFLTSMFVISPMQRHFWCRNSEGSYKKEEMDLLKVNTDQLFRGVTPCTTVGVQLVNATGPGCVIPHGSHTTITLYTWWYYAVTEIEVQLMLSWDPGGTSTDMGGVQIIFFFDDWILLVAEKIIAGRKN